MVCFCSSVRTIASSSELGTVGHAPSSLASLNQGVGALFGRAVLLQRSSRCVGEVLAKLVVSAIRKRIQINSLKGQLPSFNRQASARVATEDEKAKHVHPTITAHISMLI